ARFAEAPSSSPPGNPAPAWTRSAGRPPTSALRKHRHWRSASPGWRAKVRPRKTGPARRHTAQPPPLRRAAIVSSWGLLLCLRLAFLRQLLLVGFFILVELGAIGSQIAEACRVVRIAG